MKGFGGRLRRLREERQLTQKQLGTILGVRDSTVSLWESEANEPGQETVSLIASFFEVSIDFLLRGGARTSLIPQGTVKRLPPQNEELIRRAGSFTPEQAATVLRMIDALYPEKVVQGSRGRA